MPTSFCASLGCLLTNYGVHWLAATHVWAFFRNGANKQSSVVARKLDFDEGIAALCNAPGKEPGRKLKMDR